MRELVVTKLDVLNAFESIRVCDAYQTDGRQPRPHETLTTGMLTDVKPVYGTYEGWGDTIRGSERFPHFPRQLQDYLLHIESFVHVPVSGVSIGAERDAMIWR